MKGLLTCQGEEAVTQRQLGIPRYHETVFELQHLLRRGCALQCPLSIYAVLWCGAVPL